MSSGVAATLPQRMSVSIATHSGSAVGRCRQMVDLPVPPAPLSTNREPHEGVAMSAQRADDEWASRAHCLASEYAPHLGQTLNMALLLGLHRGRPDSVGARQAFCHRQKQHASTTLWSGMRVLRPGKATSTIVREDMSPATRPAPAAITVRASPARSTPVRWCD